MELVLKNLGIGYGRTVVQCGLEQSLMEAGVTSLLGANGAGKSTLLRTICGLEKPLEGSVLLDGRAVAGMNEREISLRIGVVWTSRPPAAALTVSEMVAMGRQPHTGFWGRLGERDRRVCARALEDVGMSSKAERYYGTLSDGERQKVMIAKALVQECPVIIMDEPTAFLDVTSRIEIMLLMRSIAEKYHRSILLSTHDLDIALRHSHYLWLLSSNGLPMTAGTPEELLSRRAIGPYFDTPSLVFDHESRSFRTK